MSFRTAPRARRTHPDADRWLKDRARSTRDLLLGRD